MQTHLPVACAGLSDRGRVRPSNEDQFLIAELNRSLLVEQTTLAVDDQTRLVGQATAKLLVVADGMGGHAHGNRASSLAVQTITAYALRTAHCLFAPDDESDETLREQLSRALLSCQRVLDKEAKNTPSLQNMGTTLTMGCIIWPSLYVVHAGDSRCYLMRDEKLHQLTRDHTAAQQMVDDGVLEQERVGNTPFGHVLSNAIIAREDGSPVQPEVSRTALRAGDAVLLCSDGLIAHVPERQMTAVLTSTPSPAEACERLVSIANEGGGSDNITVVIGRIDAG
jgi:serine/threonine protein phosphatase PrpC